jgi:hypothetical protein
VSTDDAHDPSWREDGRELYYMSSAGDLKALGVTIGPQLSFGPPVTLFPVGPGALDPPRHAFAPAPDGQRFLINDLVSDGKHLVVIENWQALLH